MAHQFDARGKGRIRALREQRNFYGDQHAEAEAEIEALREAIHAAFVAMSSAMAVSQAGDEMAGLFGAVPGFSDWCRASLNQGREVS